VHTNLCAPFFSDTTLVVRSCVGGGVLIGVVWLLAFRPNMWILITNFILFGQRKICTKKKSIIVVSYNFFSLHLPVMNIPIFNF
jgi:hypothetical protein